jgi:hypothetical protein
MLPRLDPNNTITHTSNPATPSNRRVHPPFSSPFPKEGTSVKNPSNKTKRPKSKTMTPSVRAGHKRAAKPKAIARSPRKVKTHQYFEIALIIKFPPFKKDLGSPNYLFSGSSEGFAGGTFQSFLETTLG